MIWVQKLQNSSHEEKCASRSAGESAPCPTANCGSHAANGAVIMSPSASIADTVKNIANAKGDMMIELSQDFVVTDQGDIWTVKQFYYIRRGGFQHNPITDTVHKIEPECSFRPVYEFEAMSEVEARTIARQWIEDLRQQVIMTIFLNEHPDGGWFTGGWDQNAGQWLRPLDSETRRLSGCHAEFSQQRFSPLSYEDAIQDARARYGSEAIDRQLLRYVSTSEAAQIWDIPHSSITLACRQGEIAYAAKKRDWVFPTITFLVWLNQRPGRGRWKS